LTLEAETEQIPGMGLDTGEEVDVHRSSSKRGLVSRCNTKTCWTGLTDG
jgi:hypothetical protein